MRCAFDRESFSPMTRSTTSTVRKQANPPRRRPVGAEVIPGRGVHFRVWARGRRSVEVVFEGGLAGEIRSGTAAIALRAEEDGYFSAMVSSAGERTRYRYRVDGGDPRPDPASRYQPEGPHGPSQVIDPSSFRWTDDAWRGPGSKGHVIYEVHVGTFTPEGTWAAAAEVLPSLATLGVTVLEVMPVAEFPGRFGWGYDGVDLYAPFHHYGTPDDMRRFVDRAHAEGLAVVLDVCYSHLGPDGNYLDTFSDDYFTDRYKNAWGRPFNVDGEGPGPVREFLVENVAYWVDEFHVDGIRIDATQDIHDASPDHILKALTRRAREAASGRRVLVIGENEPQEVALIRPEGQGGFGMDALWSDDFHHAAMAAATGRLEAYYSDYRGTPQEFVSVAKHGLLYQGQRDVRQAKRRGSPALGLDPGRFVLYLQNHDQLANSAWGHRLQRLTTPGRYRALTAMLLLGPGTPLLFQGQEYGASTPFLYFGDLKPEIAETMRRGRQDFLSQFPSLAGAEMKALVPRPDAPEGFRRSKLDPAEREAHVEAYALHADLLRLRRDDPTFRDRRPGGLDGAVLGPEAFVLRHFGEGGDDRLILVNLGPDLDLNPVTEPLLAPPEDAVWDLLWSSEDPKYGGSGTPAPERDDGWHILGHAAVVMYPKFTERPHG